MVRKHPKTAVFVDGSAIFHAARLLCPGGQLDYRELVEILLEEAVGLTRPEHERALWLMFTSASAQNEGQTRYLEFMRSELHWEVIRVSPADSYMVEPTELFGRSDNRAAKRLLRFDADIGFALGRAAEYCSTLVVITDSFALLRPIRSTESVPRKPSKKKQVSEKKVYLAFFSRALDPRWRRDLRMEGAPEFIDLDSHSERLFARRASDRSAESGILSW